MEAAPHPWPTLGVLLMRDGLVTKEVLEAILDEQRDTRQQRISGRRLGEILVEREIVTQEQVARLIAEQYELPFVELDIGDIDLRVATRLPKELARRFSALPISFLSDGSLLLAIADPATVLFSDELRRVLGAPLRFAVVGQDAIDIAVGFVDRHGQALVERSDRGTPAGDGVSVGPPPETETPGFTHAEDEPYFGSQRAVAHLWPPLGALLMRESLVTKAELEAALAQQRLSGSKRLGEILVERGVVATADIARLVAEQYELPFVDLAASEVELNAATLLPEEIARRFSALPIGFLPDESLRVAVADPTNLLYSDELRLALRVPLTFVVAAREAIETAIAYVYGQAHAVTESDRETTTTVDVGAAYARDDLERDETDSPMLREPVSESADDIVTEDVTVEPIADVAAAEDFTEIHPMDDVAEVPAIDGAFEPAEADDVADEDEVGEVTELPTVDAVAQTSATVDESEALAVEELAQIHPVEDVVEVPAIDGAFEPEAADDVDEDEVGEVTELPEVDAVAQTSATVNESEALAVEELAQIHPVEDVVEVPAIDGAFEPEAADDVGDENEVDEVTELPEVDAVAQTSATVDESEALAVEELPQIHLVEDMVGSAAIDKSPESQAADEVADDDEFDEVTELPEVDLAAESGAPADESEASAIDQFDVTMERAVSLGASSIHFSPQPRGLIVRARIDGVMRELEAIPSSRQASVTNRLKVMSRLETPNGTVDLRIDTLPTRQGEKMTLHISREVAAPTSLTDLGMSPSNEEAVRQAIQQPSGLVLACGPTGSGKTTTLYAALQEQNAPERILTTIEDPVEYLMPGIDQIQVDPRSGLTFARGLEMILDSDPDVILVGEIRDEETARSAVHAAMTGHLVLSTLYTRTAAAAIQRLADMGIDPGLLGSTLTCLVAQRLVRRICPDCRETYYATPDDLAELARPEEEAGRRLLVRSHGCTACSGTGYQGRVGVFEVLMLTDEIRGLVADRASTTEIQRAAVAGGMRTLLEDGVRLCLEGVTTAGEVRRVVGDWNE
jgi:type IV pilus assembly protein PilB